MSDSNTDSIVSSSYEDLIAHLEEVDKKYNVYTNRVELDLPENLGLETLTYSAPSEEQLASQAKAGCESVYEGKKLAATQKAESGKLTLRDKMAAEQLSYDDKAADLKEKFDAQVQKALESAVKQGIGQSSIAEEMQKSAREQYEADLAEAETDKNASLSSLKAQLEKLDADTADTLENLDEQQQQAVAEALAKLLAEERKKQDAVVRYNNSVSEKENKFQVTKERAYKTALSAEYQRSLAAAKLLAQLGLTSYNEKKAEEKVALAKAYFDTLPRAEAVRQFNADSTLQYHFGTYYDYVKWYVNQLPE